MYKDAPGVPHLQSQANGGSTLQPKLAAPGRYEWPASGRRDGHYQRLPAVLVGAARVSGCFLIDKGAFHSKPAVYYSILWRMYLANINRAELCSPVGSGQLQPARFAELLGRPLPVTGRSVAACQCHCGSGSVEARVDYPKRNARPGLILPPQCHRPSQPPICRS